MGTWLAVVGSFLAIITGLWKFFSRRNRQRRKLADEAMKLGKEGVDESNTSKLTASLSRLKRNK